MRAWANKNKLDRSVSVGQDIGKRATTISQYGLIVALTHRTQSEFVHRNCLLRTIVLLLKQAPTVISIGTTLYPPVASQMKSVAPFCLLFQSTLSLKVLASSKLQILIDWKIVSTL